MKRLGYTRFVAQGGDWGNAVTEVMALQAPPELLGIHTNMPATVPADIAKALAFSQAPPARPLGGRAERLGSARLLLQERPGLRQRDGQPPADALRARGLTRRPGRLDARSRRTQPGAYRARLRRQHRRPDARRHPRQRHALLADEHGDLLGAALLGHQHNSRGASSTPKASRFRSPSASSPTRSTRPRAAGQRKRIPD